MEYPPAPGGGVGLWTHTLARGLVRAGHQVHVVTPAAPGRKPSRDEEDGVRVERIAVPPFFGRSHPVIPDLHRLLRDHVYAVRDEVMRLALVHGLDAVSTPLWNVEGAALLAEPPVCTLLSLHTPLKAMLNYPPDWVGSAWFPEAFAAIQAEAEGWVLRHAKFVVANSRAVVRDLAALYEVPLDHAIVVPHGIDDDGPPGDTTAREAVNILFIGRHERRKGIDTLLTAIPELARRFPELTFTVAGETQMVEGGQATYVTDFQSRHAGEPWLGRVQFPGFVKDYAKAALFHAADIVAAPSRYESFGLVFLEAMRAGKPLVACGAGGAPEVIEDGASGILVAPGDADALEAALAGLIADAPRRRAMGQAARRTFEARFTTKQMVEAFEAAVRSAMAIHSGHDQA